MRYQIFYDGQCVLCQRSRAWLTARDRTGRFAFINSRDPGAMAQHPQVTQQETQGRIVVIDSRGQKQGGYDGIAMLLRELSGWRWIHPLLRWWGVRHLGRLLYRQVARNRYRWFGRTDCDAGSCRV